MEKNNEKEFKQTRLIIVLVAIIVILVFALGFVLGTKNNNILKLTNEKIEERKNNSTKKEEQKEQTEKSEIIKKELTEKDAKELLDFYKINSNTISNYNISNKLEVTYNYLKDNNNYKQETCKEFLKNEINNWKHSAYNEYEYYELFKATDDYYYCDGNKKYDVIPYSDYVDALKKLFNEEMKKDYWEYYYVKSSDSIIFLPYRDGTEGPSISIDKVKSIKKDDNIIKIEYYAEKLSCEDYDYQTDKSKNCGKNGWKESGTYDDIQKEIIEKYLEEVNLYRIKIEDHGDYTTFVSLEKQ